MDSLIDRVARKKFSALVELALASGGGPPPPPLNVENVFAVPFTFLSPSPVNLGAVAAGTIMNRVDVLVTIAFNDPAANVLFGLFGGSPSAFLGAGDSSLQSVGQYEGQALVTVGAADLLKLTINAGTSTQGAGLLFYKFLE